MPVRPHIRIANAGTVADRGPAVNGTLLGLGLAGLAYAIGMAAGTEAVLDCVPMVRSAEQEESAEIVFDGFAASGEDGVECERWCRTWGDSA